MLLTYILPFYKSPNKQPSLTYISYATSTSTCDLINSWHHALLYISNSIITKKYCYYSYYYYSSQILMRNVFMSRMLLNAFVSIHMYCVSRVCTVSIRKEHTYWNEHVFLFSLKNIKPSACLHIERMWMYMK